MRLYLSNKEAHLVCVVLALSRANMTREQQVLTDKVLDRLELCFKLQASEKASKGEAE